MNLTLLTKSYAVISLLASVVLVWLANYIYKSDIDKKRDIVAPIAIAIVSVICYALFLFSSSYTFAMIFTILFFIGTDILAFSMLNFSIAYTLSDSKIKYLHPVFGILCLIDSISLIVNFFTHHSFDLILLFTKAGYSYWGTTFTFYHYLHLGMDYVMVVSTFVILFVSAIKAPAFYKSKFITVLGAYAVVIFANFFSYTINSPVDFSIVLYAILAAFISYYASYTFPSYLVNKTLSSINESLSDAILYYDYSGKLVYSNAAARQIFNKTEEALPYFAEQFRMLFLEDKPEQMSLQAKDGQLHYFFTEYKDFFMQDSIVGSYLKLEDRTEEILESEHRRKVATHDSLTGLLNRTGFFETVEESLKAGIFKNPIMICSNIKDFRLVNEIFGNDFGDTVLRNLALMLTKLSHRKNINARLTDDKFVVLMEKEDFHKEVFEESIIQLSTLTQNENFHMSISIGIYEIFNKSESVSVMYDKAKMAMDSISSDYSQIFAWYDSTLMDKLLAEKNIVTEFEKALDDMQFEIYLQPINDDYSNIYGAEALVRWKHPHQRALMPEEFIEILERTGLIYKLDLYVWDLAARKIREWEKKGLDLFISVNVSSKDKYYIDVAKELLELKDKYHFDPSHMHLEVREESLVEDAELSMKLFEQLKDAGFKFTIDRFGSGYSSLNMLKDFEADAVKIDTVFLNEDEPSGKQQVILKTIFSMAEQLNMKVIAQGVESKSHLKSLKDFNCKYFQGFYYTKPLAVKDFEKIYLAPKAQ